MDTGNTLKFLLNLLNGRSPASMECCSFLTKSKALKVSELKVKWIGFDIEPVFVVGYGLDCAEKFRSLPYIAEVELPKK